MPHDVPTAEISVSAVLDARRPDILRALERRLRETGSALGSDPSVLPACMERADELLAATVRELDEGYDRGGEAGLGRVPSSSYGPVGAGGAADPADLVDRADAVATPEERDEPDGTPGRGGLLMDIVLKELLPLAVRRPELVPEIGRALTVLHRNLAADGRPPGDSYDAYIVRSAQDARQRERRRLAREVHDELGHELSIALRQLELSELYRDGDPQAAAERVGGAREHLASALLIARRLIAEFSEPPSVDLEKEIVSFADSAGAGRTAVHVRVAGSQLLIPDGHRRELFLIVREALRNVFAHAAAEAATVRVDITSEAITAVVADDGRGIAPGGPGQGAGSGSEPGSGSGGRRGFGLTSMRERAAALGGTVTVSGPVPPAGAGTRVEIRLPLP
ncbi:sensor histidine kinase [Actinacidiphila acididurans]|uniref:Oxygen sensor histidine kinase NreB n=1 Tax=Actinacidiphila acididurans TaxID=2784346 RepID=A0ABS2TVM6_9ACTN|nr:ATP-binding protein [Actinacidiphila acididurans]MBM9506345.1 ATP-binding protein [Actinacidiphila acididurans]